MRCGPSAKRKPYTNIAIEAIDITMPVVSLRMPKVLSKSTQPIIINNMPWQVFDDEQSNM